jgi:hypothetical protein
MQLKKYEIKTYVTKETHQRVTKEAVIRKTTMARVIRDGLNEYFLLREELANAIETPGEIGDSHTGKIIHTLLARNEQRFAILIEGIEEQLSVAQGQLRFLITMIDQLYLNLMKYLPKIPKEIIDEINSEAKARHALWLTDIDRILITKNK